MLSGTRLAENKDVNKSNVLKKKTIVYGLIEHLARGDFPRYFLCFENIFFENYRKCKNNRNVNYYVDS